MLSGCLNREFASAVPRARLRFRGRTAHPGAVRREGSRGSGGNPSRSEPSSGPIEQADDVVATSDDQSGIPRHHASSYRRASPQQIAVGHLPSRFRLPQFEHDRGRDSAGLLRPPGTEIAVQESVDVRAGQDGASGRHAEHGNAVTDLDVGIDPAPEARVRRRHRGAGRRRLRARRSSARQSLSVMLVGMFSSLDSCRIARVLRPVDAGPTCKMTKWAAWASIGQIVQARFRPPLGDVHPRGGQGNQGN